MAAIAARHGMPRDKDEKQNHRKQAEQIRGCLLQAREYFAAAEAATLFTSPNHLYYGMSALASSIMLLLGSGEHSLDFLRKHGANRHHGLDFTTNVNAESSRMDLSILSRSWVEVRNSGHFLNWYSRLPRSEPAFGIVRRAVEGGMNSNMESVGWQGLRSVEEMVGARFSLARLVQFLPDLRADLWRYGMRGVAGSRVSYQVSFEGDDQEYEWLLHGTATREHMEALLDVFTVTLSGVKYVDIQIDHDATAGRIEIRRPEDERFPITFPMMRDTIGGEQMMYAEDIRTKEIVDAYLMGFGLSMLSRYFPDFWIACLESHCRAAKVIERAVSVLIDKFPMLALSEFAGTKVVISLHRPPWYS